MKYLLKIELMHSLFGEKEGHTCGECKNLVTHEHNGYTYRKCAVYGQSKAISTDWAKRYKACGLFNKNYVGKPIIETGRYKVETPMDGQIGVIE